MKNKIWLTQIPFLFVFTSLYYISELGVHGRLEDPFLREKIYPILSHPANQLTDLKFSLRGKQEPKNKIIVVEIDGASIDTFGRWPWHRDATAYVIEKSFQLGAKVVGLDITFSEPDPRVPAELLEILKTKQLDGVAQSFETDPHLQKVVAAHSDHLVMGWASDTVCQPLYDGEQGCPVTKAEALATFPPGYEKFSMDTFEIEKGQTAKGFDPAKTPIMSFVTPLTNIPMYLEVAKHLGFFNPVLDSDGHIRRVNLLAMAKGLPYSILPLEMARVGLGEKLLLNMDAEERVRRLGFVNSGRAIPVSPLGVMQINFRGPSGIFRHISAVDLLKDEDLIEGTGDSRIDGTSKKDLLKDAYVLIGVTAIGVFDMRQFPFEANSPGVYGHANILDNVLSGDPLIAGSSSSGSLWVYLLMTLGMALFALSVETLNAVAAVLVFFLGFLALGLIDLKVLFENNNNWNSVFLYLELITVFGLTLSAKYILEEKNKKFLRSAFTKYVAPVIVDSILKDPTKLSLGGEKKELTILFSDIRSFTTFSEKMDAKTLAQFLNEYLGVMTGLVFSHQGTLDKYIGDAVMAFWGAPLDQPLHALHSCQSAIAMLQALEKNFDHFKTKYGIDVHIGIGINSGVVNVGNMGSEQTFEYTVIGDHVNLASRVEGLTKYYGVTILTTRFTLDSIQNSGQTPPPHRILDQVKVKGKKQAVELIQILEKEYPAEALRLFLEAKTLYQSRKWDEAIVLFTKVDQQISPILGRPDGPCGVFIERCKEFKTTPPEADWDGSWTMDSK